MKRNETAEIKELRKKLEVANTTITDFKSRTSGDVKETQKKLDDSEKIIVELKSKKSRVKDINKELQKKTRRCQQIHR